MSRTKLDSHKAGMIGVLALTGILNLSLWAPIAGAQQGSPTPGREYQIPETYYPQTEPPRWNSNIPSLVGSPEEAARIRSVSPQWLSRFLVFPSVSDISDNLGKDDPIIREKAANGIRQALAPSLIPDGLTARLIPLARWGQLHDDWRRYGGIDLYLTKFTVSNLTVLVAETSTHVIVVARDTSFVPKSGPSALRQTAFDYSRILLSSSLVPDVPEDLRTLRQATSPAYLYGYYTSRLNKLTGRSEDEQTTLTENSDSANALSVRFFTNGQLVAFMTLKTVDDPNELGNPYEPRFIPLVSPATTDPYSRPGTLEAQRGRQLEEYLGILLTPKEQAQFLERIPLDSLEKTFLELSREQQIGMVRLKMTDEYLAAGMKAFLDKKYEDAIQYWMRNMQLEPENPRVGLLLKLALERRVEQAYNGDMNRARTDSTIFQAVRALQTQQQLLIKREESRDVAAARERAMVDHRTRALQAMSEGNLAESLKQWESILRLDPGNANAQVFKELVKNRIAQGGNRAPLKNLPTTRPIIPPQRQQ